ncbi:MAG: hypothetical protein WA188_16840, partial [Terriglobales bacterium]
MTLFWSKAAVIVTSLLFLPGCSAAQTTAAPKPGTQVTPPASKVVRAKQRKHGTSKPSPEPLPQTVPPPLTPE